MAKVIALLLMLGILSVAAGSYGFDVTDVETFIRDKTNYVATEQSSSDKHAWIIRYKQAGFVFDFYAQGCDVEAKKCTSGQFHFSMVDAKKRLTLADINKFTAKTRYARLYQDNDQNPHLEYDVQFYDQCFNQAIDRSFNTFNKLAVAFGVTYFIK